LPCYIELNGFFDKGTPGLLPLPMELVLDDYLKLPWIWL